MYSRLESQIQSLAAGDYAVSYALLAGLLLFLIYYAYQTFKRYRFMDATATSRIRSAAQGQVELKGLAELMPDDSIVSPFSGSRCIWYHCTIDKKRRYGKRTTWTNISDECSEHLFRIVDDTDECIVDPDDAHVIPEIDVTWYGSGLDLARSPPKTSALLSLGFGNYRFRERLIRPATEVYALGWFRTVHSDPSDAVVSTQVEELVRQWKLQPGRYLRDFDFDANGKIQDREWQAIRDAARNAVLARNRSQKREYHLVSRSADRSHPFILSAQTEEVLVGRKKLRAYAAASGAFAVFSALVILYSIRPPLPV